jgi:hypothetical protein
MLTEIYQGLNIIILFFLSKFHPQKTEIIKDNVNTFCLCHCTLSMHLSSTRTGVKVDADNIPELGRSYKTGSLYIEVMIFAPKIQREETT